MNDSSDAGKGLEWWARIAGTLLVYAKHLTRSEHDAEDLRQDCLIRVMRNGEKWTHLDDAQIVGYFRRTLYRLWVDNYRKLARQPDCSTYNDDQPSQNEEPAALSAKRELVSILESWMQDDLKPRDRHVFQLWLEGYSYTEIDELLELKRGEARNAYYRSTRTLKRMAEAHGLTDACSSSLKRSRSVSRLAAQSHQETKDRPAERTPNEGHE